MHRIGWSCVSHESPNRLLAGGRPVHAFSFFFPSRLVNDSARARGEDGIGLWTVRSDWVAVARRTDKLCQWSVDEDDPAGQRRHGGHAGRRRTTRRPPSKDNPPRAVTRGPDVAARQQASPPQAADQAMECSSEE